MPDRELVVKSVEQAAGNSGIEGLLVKPQEKVLITKILLKHKGIATEEAFDQLLEHLITPKIMEEGTKNGIQKSLRRSTRRAI